MNLVPNAIARKVAQTGLLASKNSPRILFGVGIVGMIGTTVLASRATLRLDAVVADTQRNINIIHDMAEHAETSEELFYPASERRRDTAMTVGHGVLAVTKLYAPTVLLGMASVACLTKSHNLLLERNFALTAAYTALDEAFQHYRGRVIEKHGADEDREMMFGAREMDFVDEETGEIISTIQAEDASGNPYARYYDEFSSRNWSPDPDANLIFLQSVQNYMNDRLVVRGHVFLNEVYDALGLSHTPTGAIVGWRYKQGTGDDKIDFGIWEGTNKDAIASYWNGRDGAILLDFNVDGSIWDLINPSERGVAREEDFRV